MYCSTRRSSQSAPVKVIAHLECAVVATVIDVAVRVELVTSSAVVIRRLCKASILITKLAKVSDQ
jgi:hypothetical protein